MKNLIEWDYKTGQISLNIDMIMSNYLLEMQNAISIWNQILHRNVSIKSEERFNKKKTILEEGILTIKAKNSSSYIKISLKDKGNKLKLSIKELSLSNYEKDFFKRNTERCLYLIHYLVYRYYTDRIEKITQEGLKKLEKETNLLRSKYKDSV